MTPKSGKNHVRFSQSAWVLAALGLSLGLAGCSGESQGNLLESARKHIEKKDTKGAVIELKNLLQKNPDDAEGRYLLGKLMLDAGEDAAASVELQKAQDLGFDPDRVAPLLARIALSKGDAQKVVSTYAGKTLKLPEAQADLQVTLAKAYITLKKPVEADAAVKAALAVSPNHLGARLLEVRRLAGQKDVSGALALLDKVIESAPADSEARQLRGELLLVTGQEDAAMAAFREAIDRNPNNGAAHTSLIWLLMGRKDLAAVESQLQVLRKVAPQSLEAIFFTASLAFEKGDVKTAYETVQPLVRNLPDDPMVLQLAGAIELSKGQLMQAQTHLARALQVAPDRPRTRLLLGQVYVKSGEPTKAIKALQPLVEAAAPPREALVLMAQAYRVGGESAKSEQLFKQAAALDEKDARSRTALALAQMAKGQTEQGFEALRTISSSDPGVAADLALINGHLRRQEYDGAFKAIEQLERKQPKSPLGPYLRGRAELQRGKAKEARAAFENALRLDPTHFPSIATLASLDVGDDKFDQARQRLEAFVKARPGDPQGALLLSSLRAKSGAGPAEVQDALVQAIKANPSEVVPRVALINAMLERKDFKGGIAAAQEGLNVLPDNPELLDALGRAQFLSGDQNQAITTFTRLASLQPASAQPYLRLADVHRVRKDLPAARAALRKALDIKPDSVEARQGLMALELGVGNRKEALAAARALQRQPANMAAGFALEGDLEWSGKNWAAAAGAYRQSLAKQPSVDVAIKLHSALLRAGQADAAAKLESQWTSAPFVFYLGDLALKKGQYELARQRFTTVVQAKPDNAAALNNLAWLLNRENKPGALEMAQKAVKLAPQEPAFLDTLAEIHASKRDFAKALQIQLSAVDAAPDVPLYRLHLASYYLSSNDKAKARVELDRLAALGDKFSGQAEVKALQARL